MHTRSLNSGRRKLRWSIAIFLLLLSIPASVLFWNAMSQLKWEAAFNSAKLAQDLATRIEQGIQRRLQREERYAFADYQFLVPRGDAAQGYVERSPLAAFPVPDDLPGLVGYFQVDGEGQFTTPLLPNSVALATEYGISAEEYQSRARLAERLLGILSENRLVAKTSSRIRLPNEKAAAPAKKVTSAPRQATSEVSSPAPQSVVLPESEQDIFSDSIAESAAETDLAEGESFDAVQEFEQLRNRVQGQQAKSSELGQLSDLPLKQELALEEIGASPARPDSRIASSAKRKARKEQGLVARLVDDSPDERIKVTLFETDVSPFEFSMLDSGLFIFYRQVWKEGVRYIQGGIIQQALFIEALIAEPFRASLLADSNQLIIGYQDQALAAIGGDRSTYISRSELSGIALYETKLDAPFNEITLIFTATSLSAGQAAQPVLFTAGVFALVLVIGGMLFYRAGLKQLKLTEQQQDFVSAVSHELKTPLTSIRMYGEILLAGWADEEKKQQYYRYIFDESERLSRLISNILQLARMKRGELDVQVSSISVAELIELVQSRVGGACERAGFELRLPANADIPDVRIAVDTDAFLQVIINLVDNAIKFSAQPSVKVLDIEIEHRQSKVLIGVRDYGPGIPPDQQKKVFDLFYRVESELTRSTPGTGIGLTLIKQLLADMEATITVSSRNPGVVFVLMFEESGGPGQT